MKTNELHPAAFKKNELLCIIRKPLYHMPVCSPPFSQGFKLRLLLWEKVGETLRAVTIPPDHRWGRAATFRMNGRYIPGQIFKQGCKGYTHSNPHAPVTAKFNAHTIERAFVFTNQVIISLTIHLHMQLPSLLHRKADFCRCFFTIFPSNPVALYVPKSGYIPVL